MTSTTTKVTSKSRFGPRLRALYLLGVAIGVFFLPPLWPTLVSALSQILFFLGVGLGFRALGEQLKRLVFFLSVIVIAYALVSTGAQDRWVDINLGIGNLSINLEGLKLGCAMALRVVTIVVASCIVRAGNPRAIAQGLSGLGLPRTASLSIDATLALLGKRTKGRGGGGGGGRGGGGGGRSKGELHDPSRAKGAPTPKPTVRERLTRFFGSLSRLARGDVSIIAQTIEKQINRAQDHVHSIADVPEHMARDVAVISGFSLTMLGIKALKLLPGLPFAPGHKGVLLIPLYIAAGSMTRSRLGATMTGLTMGSAAFLLGDGRWGIFEIAKHVAPGIVVDLLGPFLKGRRERWVWITFGFVVAMGRFTTVTLIALLVQAPAVVYAFLLPGLAVHAIFGVLSGIVTAPLLRAMADSIDNEGQ